MRRDPPQPSPRGGRVARSGLARTLTDALADPAPHRLEDGNVIRPGYDGELDAERSLRDDSRRRAGNHAARLRAALWRRQPEDQASRAAWLRHRSAGRQRRKAARLPGTDVASGHGQWRPLHHARPGRTRPPHLRGRRTRRRPRTHRVRASGAQRAGTGRRAGRLRRRARLVGCGAIGGEAGGIRHLVPPGRDRRRRVPDPRRPPPGGGSRAGRPRRLRPQPLRPLARTPRPAAHRAEHGRQVHLPAAECADRRAGAGLPAGAGRIRAYRRGGPVVQPRRGLGRPGARPLHLHGGNDRDRGDPAPGRTAFPGGGGRDRPRHRHARRAGDRLGGARGAAFGHSLPHHFRHTFS